MPAAEAGKLTPPALLPWGARPTRIKKGRAEPLDLAKIGSLTFEAPDYARFPGLKLAYDALRTGSGATTVYNAANIDNSKVIWAREMDPASDRELTEYYKGRKVWLVQPDTQPLLVIPYIAESIRRGMHNSADQR